MQISLTGIHNEPRLPATAAEMPISAVEGMNVAVIGGGLMGHAIAGLHAAAGAQVTVLETDAESRRSMHGRIHASFTPLGSADRAVANTSVTSDSGRALSGSDIVIEAAVETIAVKNDLVRLASRFAPESIFATNTSAIRISDIAESHANPELVVGTHYFNPPHLIPLVEVVPGQRTSPNTVQKIAEYLRSIDKIPAVLSSDPPGFVANRIQHAMWREALALLEAGVADAETIDLIVCNSFGPRLTVMGPIENADYVGLDLIESIHSYLFPHLSSTTSPSTEVLNAVARGKLGRKTGQGITTWTEQRAQQATERLASHLITTFSSRKG